MRILISWMAVVNDFNNVNEVNDEGLTPEFYRYHYFLKNYDKHILLRTDDMQSIHKANTLTRYLRQEFDFTNIDIRALEINDIININEIKTKVEALLLELKNDDIDIFFQPGTALMQLVWYLLHEALNLNTHLIQAIRKEHWKNPTQPELKEIKVEKSSQAYSLSILDHEKQKKAVSRAFITPTLQKVYKRADKVAQTDKVTALILGASGSGKELLARYIHDHSIRKEGIFQAVNCAAFSDNLLESRLFGHIKGAFTDAKTSSKGIMLEAKGGTVFLDEIGDISAKMQAMLLRFLQNQEFHPVGATKSRKTDVRIVAATNKNLYEMCEQGKFRWDLYYRLHVAVLELPSLVKYLPAERKKYIHFFVIQKQKALNKNQRLRLSPSAEKILFSYSFPGNFRELENIIEQLYVFYDNEIIKPENLPQNLLLNGEKSEFNLKTVEKKHIAKVLGYFKGNLTHTKDALGISMNTLKSKIKNYGIKN